MNAAATGSNLIEAKVEAAAVDPVALDDLFSAVGPARIPQPIREESAAALKMLAARRPDVLAGRLDDVATLLDSDNAFTRMAMVHVIGTLGCADRTIPLDELVDRLMDHMADDKVSVAGHVFIAAGEIAQARPELARRITARVLDLSRVAARPERIGLLRSYAIEALDAYLAPEDRTPDVLAFVGAGLQDDSPKTRKLAADILRRWDAAAPASR